MGAVTQSPANRDPLTPLALLERTVRVFPAQDRGGLRRTALDLGRVRPATAGASRARCSGRAWGRATASRCWRRTCPRCWRRTSRCRGCGAALVAINTRLSPARSATSSTTAAPSVVLVDPELAPRVAEAPAGRGRPLLVNLEDPESGVGGHAAARALVRRVPRRRARARDERRRRRRRPHALDQLHLGHDRASEGRHVHAPRRAAERARRDDRAAAGARLRLPVDAAALPLQRLVLPVGGDRRRRHARDAARARARRASSR